MLLGILTRIKRRWSWILHWLLARFRPAPPVPAPAEPPAPDPYARPQVTALRVIAHDGQLLADAARWFSVSRHGLVQQGITCPSCGLLAASEGRADLIHETRLGEAVHCPGCQAILLASPDDDVDPVKPGDLYDRSVYHAFVRPKGKETSKQRVTNDPITAGSAVVVVTRQPVVPVSEGQAPTVMYGEEVRVESLRGDDAIIQAFGNGLGGQMMTLWRVPVAGLAAMVQPSLRPGDRLRVIRGPHAGAVGRYEKSLKGKITIVTDDDASVEVIIEHVEKLITNERTY